MIKRAALLLLIPLVLFAGEKDVRPFLQGGPWYPADADGLRRMLDGYFAPLPPPDKDVRVRAIVAPHAGYAYSGRCAAKAYAALYPAQGIRRVILMGSSHRSGFYGACVADYEAWATPLGRVAVDLEACRALARARRFSSDRGLMLREHALENQLPFLQRALGDGFRVVPILFGSLRREDFAAMAEAIAPLVDDSTLLVASSDLTHFGEGFGYTPFRNDLAANLEKLDKGFIDPILRLDLGGLADYRERTGITACGFVPIGVLIRLLGKQGVRAKLADYSRSGDLNGDYSTSVSYASILFFAGPAAAVSGRLERGEQALLLELARATLRDRLQGGSTAAGLSARCASHPRLARAAGVFVTLRLRGELRGCIGSIVGNEPLWQGVAANALRAAFADPRFAPLAARELDAVDIEISPMTPLQPVRDWRAIRLRTDGVVIRDGMAQAVFLPQVASETGWGLEEFLGRLCLKAGLARDAFRTSPTLRFFVFQAQVFGEKEAAR
jgi:hypothetical protein